MIRSLYLLPSEPHSEMTYLSILRGSRGRGAPNAEGHLPKHTDYTFVWFPLRDSLEIYQIPQVHVSHIHNEPQITHWNQNSRNKGCLCLCLNSFFSFLSSSSFLLSCSLLLFFHLLFFHWIYNASLKTRENEIFPLQLWIGIFGQVFFNNKLTLLMETKKWDQKKKVLSWIIFEVSFFHKLTITTKNQTYNFISFLATKKMRSKVEKSFSFFSQRLVFFGSKN